MANLNDDLSELVIAHTDDMPWQPSPSPTVWRKRLELRGPIEAGRVTSVVRYDPNSEFPAHDHPDGEEILVLDGVFSDEHGDYPAGTYLLNPEGFRHAPRSRAGCVLFVKLRQYGGPDRRHVHIDTDSAAWQPHPVHAGVDVLPLYADAAHPDEMRLVRFGPGVALPAQPFPGGEEIFVLAGGFDDEHGSYRAGSWVRYPPGASHAPRTNANEGCTLYVKKGHLAG